MKMRMFAFGAGMFMCAIGAHAATYGVVTRVVDSDTIAAIVFPDGAPGVALVRPPKLSKEGRVLWGGVSVRVNGIDTPEKFQPKCPAEKALALKATEMVKEAVKPGDTIRLRNVQLGKYAGRVVADVDIKENGRWVRLADRLIAAGLAYEYHGGHKKSWCE